MTAQKMIQKYGLSEAEAKVRLANGKIRVLKWNGRRFVE